MRRGLIPITITPLRGGCPSRNLKVRIGAQKQEIGALQKLLCALPSRQNSSGPGDVKLATRRTMAIGTVANGIVSSIESWDPYQ